MKFVRRLGRKISANIRLKPRLDDIKSEIEKYLGNDIRLKSAGARGRDYIYLVIVNHEKYGMLRVGCDTKRVPQQNKSMPYIILPIKDRIQREWEAYSQASKYSLTPDPVWKRDDSLLCSYLPYTNMQNKLLDDRQSFWMLLNIANEALNKLHKLKISHMDASLANILANNGLDKLFFIDFEMAPNKLSFKEQAIYDYLRLLESCMKFIPAGYNKNNNEWLTMFEHTYLEMHEKTRLDKFVSALPRLSNDSILWPEIKKIIN